MECGLVFVTRLFIFYLRNWAETEHRVNQPSERVNGLVNRVNHPLERVNGVAERVNHPNDRVNEK
jgi:hypothetical protein